MVKDLLWVRGKDFWGGVLVGRMGPGEGCVEGGGGRFTGGGS